MSERCDVVRRATEAEIRAEQFSNLIDLWFQKYLDLDARTVAKAAHRLWGPPVPGGTPGEHMWKLFCERLGVPVYIAVGLLRPAVLFSDGQPPKEGEGDRLRDEIREILSEAE